MPEVMLSAVRRGYTQEGGRVSTGADSESGAGTVAGSCCWLFGQVEFDERTLELRVGGTPVALEKKGLEVLRALLHRAGEVVTKEEILESVWPGRILSETVLTKCISRIREVVGDTDQSVIRTVYGYGYRLVASVSVKPTRAASTPRLNMKAGDRPPQRPLWGLLERLGSGGQGEVWLVEHHKTRERRVFKFALDVTALSAIKREITLFRILREALPDRNDFVAILDWNLEETPYYIEMEHASGGNLESWCEARGGVAGLPLATRLEIAARVADALAAAHSVGILHKDLKPTNVLIEGSGLDVPHLKLADFGSGGVVDAARFDAFGITRMGFSVLAGDTHATPIWLAPEALTGQPATVQGDIYSLGVMLYQLVAGDLKRPLAPGWELEVEDALLREDIAAAVAGDRTRRLGDASALAARLRTLEPRRLEREAQHAERIRLEQEQLDAQERARRAELTIARLRGRRTWMLTALATLIVGFAVSLSLYLETRRARDEATRAATTSSAVADFLGKDMFAVVGTRPSHDLTVNDLLEAASANLSNKPNLTPEAAARIHASLGRAFWTLERPADSERHLNQALALFERLDGVGSEDAVATASQLILSKMLVGKAPATLDRYEAVLAEGTRQLGPGNPAILELRHQIAQARFILGQWPEAAEDFAALIRDVDASAESDAPAFLAGSAEMTLGRVLVRLGRYREALDVLSHAQQRLSGRFGPNHLLVGQVRAEAGSVLGILGRFDEAESELASATAIVRPWSVGESGGAVLSLGFLDGQLQLREGRTAEAIARLESVLTEVTRSGWNQQSDQSYEIRQWLGRAYQAGGRTQDAIAQLRDARQVAVATLGPRSPIALGILIELADLLRTSGDLDGAGKALDEVDGRIVSRLGETSSIAMDWARARALLALARGDSAAAVSLLGRVDTDCRSQLPVARCDRAARELAIATARQSTGSAVDDTAH